MVYIEPEPVTVPAGVGSSTAPSMQARRRLLQHWGEPFLLADWVDVLMIHLEVDPEPLQRDTPFALDLYQGRAFVSLVAFTMRRLRPRVGGTLAAWLFCPIATHPFLNVRTYVRHQDEVGIHFLAEWVPNPWSLRLAPRSFGLPYRLGRLDYGHQFEAGVSVLGEFAGSVVDASSCSRFLYEGTACGDDYTPCAEGSLEDWLMERYTAFTHVREPAHCSVRNTLLVGHTIPQADAPASVRRTKEGFSQPPGCSRYFRVWHPPWRRKPVLVDILERSLLTAAWPWMTAAKLIGASGSPGFQDVWMSRPRQSGKRKP